MLAIRSANLLRRVVMPAAIGRLNGIFADADLPQGYGRFISAAAPDPRLRGGIGIQGNSFGELFAALVASEYDQVDACVVNGAPPEPAVPPFRSPREQILAMFGTEDVDAVERILEELRFDPARRKVLCPMMVLHGGADVLVTSEEQARFLEAGDRSTAEMRVWEDGEHTLYNHSDERNALVADWFAEHLASKVNNAGIS